MDDPSFSSCDSKRDFHGAWVVVVGWDEVVILAIVVVVERRDLSLDDAGDARLEE